MLNFIKNLMGGLQASIVMCSTFSGQEVVADIWQGTSVSNKHTVARYQHSPQSPDNVKQKSIRQPTRGGRKGGAKNTKRVEVAELWGVVVEEGGFQNKTNHLTA